MEDEKDLSLDTGGETPEVSPETTPVSAKQKFRDNFASAYPDVDMDDEDAYYGALNERDEQYGRDKSRLDELEGAQRAFGEAMDANPRAAELFLELTKKDGKPIDMLISGHAREFADLVNDPDNDEYREALAKAVTDEVAAEQSRKELEAQAEENIGPSLDALSKVAGEMGLSDEQVADAMKTFVDFTKDLVVDKVSEDMWRVFINGLNYDSAVEQARMEGETAGRNARITEKLRREQPSAMDLSGSSATGSPQTRRRSAPSLGSSVWDESE